ncbi:MAG: sulfur oxidation c-type cytochrome SoxX, partial [Limnohabitans sp.]
MNKKTSLVLASLTAALVAVGCATGPSVAELNALTDQIVKASFRDHNGVKVERITATDETNRACSEADVAGKPLDEKTAKALEAANFKTIKWPSDGQFIGDWKEGEKIAQSGRGLTWSDDAKTVNGGNCYNCHQMD